MIVAALVYVAMATAAVGWAHWADHQLWTYEAWIDASRSIRMIVSLACGAAIAIAVIAGTRVLVRRTKWAAGLHTSFRQILGRMSGAEIAFFALSSAFGEELFFRGAMQPSFGLVPTALLFGLAHIGPTRRFIPWTVSAIVVGLVFGLLFAMTGELVGVVLAHALINYENLHFIDAFDPTREGPREFVPPTLTGGQSRAAAEVPPGRGFREDRDERPCSRSS